MSGLAYNRSLGTWEWKLPHKKGAGYGTQIAAAKDYAKELVAAEPKYKELVEGKPWREVFRILGIELIEP